MLCVWIPALDSIVTRTRGANVIETHRSWLSRDNVPLQIGCIMTENQSDKARWNLCGTNANPSTKSTRIQSRCTCAYQ